jgi:hypothetical protein
MKLPFGITATRFIVSVWSRETPGITVGVEVFPELTYVGQDVQVGYQAGWSNPVLCHEPASVPEARQVMKTRLPAVCMAQSAAGSQSAVEINCKGSQSDELAASDEHGCRVEV